MPSEKSGPRLPGPRLLAEKSGSRLASEKSGPAASKSGLAASKSGPAASAASKSDPAGAIVPAEASSPPARLRRAGGEEAFAGTIAPAGSDFEAAEAAGPDFEAAGPDFEAAGPDFEADDDVS